jgi:hypothetical protein
MFPAELRGGMKITAQIVLSVLLGMEALMIVVILLIV